MKQKQERNNQKKKNGKPRRPGRDCRLRLGLSSNPRAFDLRQDRSTNEERPVPSALASFHLERMRANRSARRGRFAGPSVTRETPQPPASVQPPPRCEVGCARTGGAGVPHFF